MHFFENNKNLGNFWQFPFWLFQVEISCVYASSNVNNLNVDLSQPKSVKKMQLEGSAE